MKGFILTPIGEISKEGKLRITKLLNARDKHMEEALLKFSNMEHLKHTTTEMVRNGNMATYDCCIGSNLIYNFVVDGIKYTVPIDVSDRAEVGQATFNKQEKVMFILRWINKAIKSGDLRWQAVVDRGESL